jgi:uncharacterized membrane protein YoaK (UPF0700 family)
MKPSRVIILLLVGGIGFSLLDGNVARSVLLALALLLCVLVVVIASYFHRPGDPPKKGENSD